MTQPPADTGVSAGGYLCHGACGSHAAALHPHSPLIVHSPVFWIHLSMTLGSRCSNIFVTLCTGHIPAAPRTGEWYTRPVAAGWSSTAHATTRHAASNRTAHL